MTIVDSLKRLVKSLGGDTSNAQTIVKSINKVTTALNGNTSAVHTIAQAIDALNPALLNNIVGGAVAKKDVNFYDYDGTLLHSYSASEFAALTEMPTNPTHAGLTSQGWNWSLADAKEFVAKYGVCDIGQMYITDDGKTRIYLEIPEERRSPVLVLLLNGTVTVDWGDGSAIDTLTGTSLEEYSYVAHTYPSSGSYVLRITSVEGEYTFGTLESDTFSVGVFMSEIPPYTKSNEYNEPYLYAVRKVEIGSGISTIGNSVFLDCKQLKTITIPYGITSIGKWSLEVCTNLQAAIIPDGVTSIGEYAFDSSASLSVVVLPRSVSSIEEGAICETVIKSIVIPDLITSVADYLLAKNYILQTVTIPDGVTAIGEDAFWTCYSLQSIAIPSGVTSIGEEAFDGCNVISSIMIPDGVTTIEKSTFEYCPNLQSITIPSGVTSIGERAFFRCASIKKIYFKSVTPPTIVLEKTGNIKPFYGLKEDCIIYVPAGSLEAYKAAENYPDPNTYTYVEET